MATIDEALVRARSRFTRLTLVNTTDVIGGFEAWQEAGLPVKKMATSACTRG